MPTFDTPDPIAVTIDAISANVTLVAGERRETTVDIRPTDENDDSDVRAAASTKVEHANGRLLVKGPRRRGLFSKRAESVDIRVELPAGSTVDVDLTVGGCTTQGRLGECRVKTSGGTFSLDRTGPLRLNTGFGGVYVEHAEGDVEVTTGTGEVRLGTVDGPAVVKNRNGDTRIGRVTGRLQVNAANGSVEVGHAGGAVVAKSANGALRVGEVVRGTVELRTAAGDLEIGVRQGTAAWLDVSSAAGRVLNSMTATDQPDTGDTVEVRARTSFGDIVVRHA